MNSSAQFDRLIRLVQETGERVVVSFGVDKDPVVLLPLSAYEALARQGGGAVSPHVPSHQEVPTQLSPLRQKFESMPAPLRAPSISSEELSQDPADVWDGESGGEYDSERLFATAVAQDAYFAGKMTSAPRLAPHPPERIKTSISQASQALDSFQSQNWRAGNGGQRLPIQNSALSGEERFSLGLG